MNEPKENIIEELLAEIDNVVSAKTAQELAKLEHNYAQRLATIQRLLQEIPPNVDTSLILMQYCILQCLHIYARYRQMELDPPEPKDAEAVDLLLTLLDNAERKLHWGSTNRLDEWLILQNLTVFLLALKTHVLLLANRTPGELMSAALHFSCEMQNYKNMGEYGSRSLQIGRIPNSAFLKLIMGPINLFSLGQAGVFISPWNRCTVTAIITVFNHITAKDSELFSATTQDFAKYVMQCFSNRGTFTLDVAPPEPADFSKKLCLEIPRALLSQTTQVESSLEKDALSYGKLLFIHAQLLGIILAEPNSRTQPKPILETYISIQTRLEDQLLLLGLYRYFLNKPSLFRFMDVDLALEFKTVQGPKPSLESKESRIFFCFLRHLADPHCDTTTLLEFAVMPESNNTKRLLIYFLLGASKNTELCLQALKKLKPSKTKTYHPAFILGLSALDEFFNPQATAEKKIRAVRNYFIEVKKSPTPPQRFFTYKAIFFLICKIGLTMENAELCQIIREELLVKSANNSNNKKKKKKKKKNGEQNTVPKIQPVDVLCVEIEPANPTPIEEISVPTVVAHEIQPSTPVNISPQRAKLLDFCGYLDRMRELNPEMIYDAKRKLAYPLSEIENRFNSRVTFGNTGKYALFSFGEVHIGNPDHVDLIANCSWGEAQELLELQQAEFEKNRVVMDIKPIRSKHPHFFVTFENYPHLAPMRVSTFTDATQKPVLALVGETQKTLGYLPFSLFGISVGDKNFIIDFNRAIKTEKGKPNELCLISENHDEKNAILTLLLGIEFLAKHPSFKASQELLAWIERNKHCLRNPHAIHPVVKLLFSGIAHRSLLLMKELGLLGDFFKPLENLVVENSAFMAWVQNFDIYYSFGCKLTARVNYPSVFINVLAQFFFPVQALPHHVPYAAQQAVFDQWGLWSSQQQQQPSSPKMLEKKYSTFF